MPSTLEEVLSGTNLFDAFTPTEAREHQREEDADDARFLTAGLYFFELIIPSSAMEEPPASAETVSMLFPLVLNPQMITMSEPFSVAVTPTVAGGLFVEENGILARTIRIEGHTGFRPKLNRTRAGYSQFVKVDNFSFERRGTWTMQALSGQRHFQFLQDRVFRTYGELKRDPATAKETQLIYHNVKDEEHFVVIPLRFDMRRDVRERFVYRYSIELLAVKKGSDIEEVVASEDKGWFDKLKDTIRDIKNAVDTIVATVNEVKKFVGEIEQFVVGVIQLVGEIANVINSISDFVNGIAEFIAAPFKAIADVTSGIKSAVARFIALPDTFRDTVTHAFRQMEDAFDVVSAHREAFATPTQKKIAKLNNLREIGTSVTQSELIAAEATPANTATEYAQRGTAPLPGDRRRARASRAPTTRTPTFTSAIEHIAIETDTLESLAARFLGDARHWRLIAALNGLASPYISTVPLPNTVRPGERLLIPSRSRPLSARPNTGVFGASPEAPLAEQLLGVDALLVAVLGRRDLYDFALDVASGGTDVKLVRGIPNLSQAMRTRIITEQGSNILYRRLGVKRLIGIGLPDVDGEIVRHRFREAITADPRIARVGNIRVTPETTADAVDVELDAQVRGFNLPVTVRALLAA